MSLSCKELLGVKENHKDIERNRKPNPQQETSYKPLLLFKRPRRSLNWAIGKPSYSYSSRIDRINYFFASVDCFNDFHLTPFK